jgi:hypothetical protein
MKNTDPVRTLSSEAEGQPPVTPGDSSPVGDSGGGEGASGAKLTVQWIVNGVKVGAPADSFDTSGLQEGDVVTYALLALWPSEL